MKQQTPRSTLAKPEALSADEMSQMIEKQHAALKEGSEAMEDLLAQRKALRARADALEAALRRVVTDFDAGYLQPYDLTDGSKAISIARKALANGGKP